MPSFAFRQVDVFPGSALGGNPLAVVLDAEGLGDAELQALARWTHLSETTFLLPPTTPDADYRVRIFTPASELPFAGHPTLGSAHAWAEHTGTSAGRLVQECGAGLVALRRTGDGWAFAAPPLTRSGPASDEDVERIAAGLGIGPWDVLAAEWVDNGPGWVVVVLRDAEAVLELQPDPALMRFPTGVIGPHPAEGPADFEVRAFVSGLGVDEDPVTGSLNAGIGSWFFASGRATRAYTVRQGTRVGADGLVRVSQEADDVWVAGATRTVITGSIDL